MAVTTHWYCSQFALNLSAGHRDAAVGHGERSLAITRQINDHPKYLLRYLWHL